MDSGGDSGQSQVKIQRVLGFILTLAHTFSVRHSKWNPVVCRKDVDQFFAWPVNDVIAPGYSSIILHPMDFSTMKRKIDCSEYNSIDEYKVRCHGKETPL